MCSLVQGEPRSSNLTSYFGCRTVVLTALHPSDVKALQSDGPKGNKLQLLAPDFQAALHPGFPPPPVAAVVLPTAGSASAWKPALASAEESAVAAAKSFIGAGVAPPAAGATAAGKLLEAEVASRQQAAIQGLLSMLQMRSESARGRAQVRLCAATTLITAYLVDASRVSLLRSCRWYCPRVCSISGTCGYPVHMHLLHATAPYLTYPKMPCQITDDRAVHWGVRRRTWVCAAAQSPTCLIPHSLLVTRSQPQCTRHHPTAVLQPSWLRSVLLACCALFRMLRQR